MLENKILKNFMYKLILNSFNLIIPMLVTPIIYRRLGPIKIGEIEYSNVIYNYFFIFASFGIYNYGIKKISKIKHLKENVDKLFTELFILNIFSNCIMLCIYSLYIYSTYRKNDEYIFLCILGFGLISNIFYIEWINEAFENYKFITKKTLFVRALMIICLLIFVKTEKNAINYIILLTIGTFINNILSYIYITKKININLKNLNLRQHIIPLLVILIMANVNILYTQLDKTMLGKYSSIQEVAYYSISQKISGIIQVIIGTLMVVSSPKLAYYIKNDFKKYKELLSDIFNTTIFFGVPLSFGLFVISSYVIRIFGGKDFISAAIVLKIFALRLIINLVDSIINGKILFLYNKEKISVFFYFIFGILNLFLNYMNQNKLTAKNCIFITLFCETFLLISQSFYINKKYKELNLIYKYRNLFKYILGSSVFIVIEKMITINIKIDEVLKLIFIILVCVIYYIIYLFLVKDIYFIKLIKIYKRRSR